MEVPRSFPECGKIKCMFIFHIHTGTYIQLTVSCNECFFYQ